jgi:hypothetical protein
MQELEFFCAYEWFDALQRCAAGGIFEWSSEDLPRERKITFVAISEAKVLRFSISLTLLKLAPLVSVLMQTPSARVYFARILERSPSKLQHARLKARWGHYIPSSLIEINRIRREAGREPLSPTFDGAWCSVERSLKKDEVELGECHPAETILIENQECALDILEVLILHTGRTFARSGLLLLGRMPSEWIRANETRVRKMLLYWVAKPRIDVEASGRAHIRLAVIYAAAWLGPSFLPILDWDEPVAWLEAHKRGVQVSLQQRMIPRKEDRS